VTGVELYTFTLELRVGNQSANWTKNYPNSFQREPIGSLVFPDNKTTASYTLYYITKSLEEKINNGTLELIPDAEESPTPSPYPTPLNTYLLILLGVLIYSTYVKQQ
jgi:hypothetical protein